jgi:hypothetical protein
VSAPKEVMALVENYKDIAVDIVIHGYTEQRYQNREAARKAVEAALATPPAVVTVDDVLYVVAHYSDDVGAYEIAETLTQRVALRATGKESLQVATPPAVGEGVYFPGYEEVPPSASYEELIAYMKQHGYPRNGMPAPWATPPAVSEPFEKIEELPDVLPAQTEQDTEATVWVDGETMAALVALAERVSCDDCTTLREYSALTSVVERCRVAPEVG